MPSRVDGNLTGRTALVTGAGRGLGRAMATHLARAGARVALVARSHAEIEAVAAALQGDGATAVAIPADVTDADAVERAVEAAESALGPLDLLVNNAGDGAVPGPIWEADPERWWRVFEVNLLGAFLGTRAALRRMVPRGHGRIVNVSSRAGNVAVPFASAYSTSKGALTRFTEIAAAEARPHGVQLFALEPGTVRTAMTETLLESEAGRTWLPWYRQTFDAGQDASPDEAAALVVRLARGDADALSGRFISRADDLDALVAEAEAVVGGEKLVLRLNR
ncbi:SDR family NAD(P)-dependent oxidoreductase [Roseisolibacter agri]|uniref:SDR family NAD(P)-dependent oxidoreductase n=1 Tax=Roseisolibacter agri TaxID=2014610 RepID=UPI0024E0C2E0|nr:SDR family oxidoreductase [Roseisolibacter agri]